MIKAGIIFITLFLIIGINNISAQKKGKNDSPVKTI